MKGKTTPKIFEIIMHIREVTAVKGSCEHGTEPLGFTECGVISWLCEALLARGELLYCVESAREST